METGLRVLLLVLVSLALSSCASAPAAPAPTDEELARADEAGVEADEPRVIEPEVERRNITVPEIDTENVELGAFFGVLSIEDFGSQPVYGVTGALHLTEDFFALAEVGRAKAGRTSVETFGGNIQLLTDDQRELTYY